MIHPGDTLRCNFCGTPVRDHVPIRYPLCTWLLHRNYRNVERGAAVAALILAGVLAGAAAALAVAQDTAEDHS